MQTSMRYTDLLKFMLNTWRKIVFPTYSRVLLQIFTVLISSEAMKIKITNEIMLWCVNKLVRIYCVCMFVFIDIFSKKKTFFILHYKFTRNLYFYFKRHVYISVTYINIKKYQYSIKSLILLYKINFNFYSKLSDSKTVNCRIICNVSKYSTCNYIK